QRSLRGVSKQFGGAGIDAQASVISSRYISMSSQFDPSRSQAQMQPMTHDSGAVGIGSQVIANGTRGLAVGTAASAEVTALVPAGADEVSAQAADRKSTRLNSSHVK